MARLAEQWSTTSAFAPGVPWRAGTGACFDDDLGAYGGLAEAVPIVWKTEGVGVQPAAWDDDEHPERQRPQWRGLVGARSVTTGEDSRSGAPDVEGLSRRWWVDQRVPRSGGRGNPAWRWLPCSAGGKELQCGRRRRNPQLAAGGEEQIRSTTTAGDGASKEMTPGDRGGLVEVAGAVAVFATTRRPPRDEVEHEDDD